MWQSLYDELKDQGFMVVAVAEESRGAQHARPWIEEAKSDYWQLIDTEHRLSDLYNLVNVPQAVWIDEQGRIVRPPETAGSTDHFRRMDAEIGLEASAAQQADIAAVGHDEHACARLAIRRARRGHHGRKFERRLHAPQPGRLGPSLGWSLVSARHDPLLVSRPEA